MLNSIQVLRALAAWLVVFHHCMQLVFDFQYSNMFEWFLIKRGMAGVDLFFVISGFIMVYITAESRESPFLFLSKRIIRIAPNYWFYTIVMALLLLALPELLTITKLTTASFFQSLFFWPHMNPSGEGQLPLLTVGWSLNYEMYFYFIFAMTLIFAKSLRTPILILTLILITEFWPWRWSLEGFLHNHIIYEFLFGAVLAGLLRSNRLSKPNIYISVFVIILGLSLLIIPSQPMYRPYYWGMSSGLILYGALGLERILSSLRLLVAMGNLSYSTYLCHVPIIILIEYARVRYYPALTPVATIVFSLIAIFVFSWLSHKHIELKSHKILTSLFLVKAKQR